MSDDIKAGDNVMLVRPTFCCGCRDLIGSVFTVVKVFDESIPGWCGTCGAEHRYGPGMVVELECGNGCDIRRLQKLPPLTEDEHIDTEQDLGVPA